MNLRRWFPLQQLLFAAALFCGFVAFAQDTITTRDGKTTQTKILGVTGSSVQVQVGGGSIGVPLASVVSVTMAAPSDFAAGVTAYEGKDYPKALASLKNVTDKYKGLPVDWAQQSTVMLGDIYVAMNRFADAEAAYRDYQKYYPGAGSTQADVGMARIAISKKDYATAKQKLEPILAQALKEKAVAKNIGPVYSNAFYLSGQIKEAGGDYTGALEDYLRTVTLFYHDRVAVNAAQERADAVRKEHGVAVP